MKAWRVAVCAGVVALVGCAGPHRAPPHTAVMPRDGRQSAALQVVSGAATVIAGTASLGDDLIRVSTPANSGVRPSLAGRGPVRLYLDPAGGTVLAAAGWAGAASRYDIQAPAGVSAISVAG